MYCQKKPREDLGRRFKSSQGLPKTRGYHEVNGEQCHADPLPPGKSEHLVFDDVMHGFGLRIRAGERGQHRTYIIQYKIGAKHRRITLGSVAKVRFVDAKEGAQTIFAKVKLGQDPANEKAEARNTLSHTLEATIGKYIAAKQGDLRTSTLVENERILKKHWKPLRELTLASVTRAHVAAWLHGSEGFQNTVSQKKDSRESAFPNKSLPA